MPDPFESLRAPVTPVPPDPVFAARLRARIARLLTPGGISVSDLTVDLDSPTATADLEPAARPTRHGDIVFASLNVPDVVRAATFFGAVLGWRYTPGSGAQGRQVEGVNPHLGLWGGEPRSTLFLCYGVDDLDQALERVRAAGGVAGPASVRPYGPTADCVDPEGTPFALNELTATTPAPARPGQADLGYVTMEVRESARARAFYGEVLGWRFHPGRVEDGWQVEDVVPLVGMRGGVEQPVAVPFYHVDDVASAVARVRAAGGTATDPERQPYGVSSECTDDQGTRFYLGET